MAIDTEERNPKVNDGSGSTGGGQKLLIIIAVVIGGIIILGILGMMAVGWLFASFGSSIAEQAIESATGGQVDMNLDGSGEMTFKGDNGESIKVTAATEVPDGFPADVPLYENAKVMNVSTVNMGADEGSTYTVTALSDDSLSAVKDYFISQLSSEAGWKIMSNRSSAEHVSIMAAKTDQSTMVVLTIVKDDSSGQTQIHISTRVKPATSEAEVTEQTSSL